MLDASGDLRPAAIFVGTYPGGVAEDALQRRPAFRAVGDKFDFQCIGIAVRHVHAHDLGDDFARFLHIKPVSLVDVEFLDYVVVMQRGTFHDRARQLHRFQIGHRCDDTHAACFERNEAQGSAFPFGIEFKGHCPAGRFRRGAHADLLAPVVDLEYQSVGRDRQLLAVLVPVSDIVVDILHGLEQSHLFGYLETPLGGVEDIVVMILGGEMVAEQIVEAGVEMTAGHFAGILHFQRTRSRVARIGEEWLLVVGPFGVQFLEHFPGHQNLAADLEFLGPVTGQQFQGYAADGFHIGGDIVALRAVTASHGANHAPVAVGDGNGRAVEFHLADNIEILTLQGRRHSLHPFVHLLDIIRIGQRHHGTGMSHVLESLR